MSGHSKWSKIKRQKGMDDAKRGQVYTKLSREIIIAVREGGPSPDANFRLRLVIQKAREQNMPNDNVERAIKKGSGEAGGAIMAEVTYEGYAPGGAAIIVQTLTDNRNRTLNEVRNTFSRAGGNLGEAGSVGWLFERKGIITMPAEDFKNIDDLTLELIDAGADDVKVEDGTIEIYTKAEDLHKVKTYVQQKKYPISSMELTMISKQSAPLDDKTGVQTLKLIEKLEEMDDVQNVYTNADIPESAMEAE